MKVCISVGGRFHAFNLAHQLYKRGHLQQLITSYPKFEAAKYGIPKSEVTSLMLTELVARMHRYLPTSLQWRGLDFQINDWFDRRAAKHLPACDICTAWSSFGLHTIRKAKTNGAITIIERGSSHVEYQRDILEEENAKFGITRPAVPPLIVEKELIEYQEADYIAIPSEFVKRTFLEKGIPEEKLIHVPYGVDLGEFRPLPKADDVFRVINVGTQGIRKGTIYLLRAFTQLQLPDAELLLVGAIEEEIKPHLRRYGNMIRHVSPVPQSELLHYYARGSVFVICSIEEGLAMVQAQAMACGLPVICTTNTGGSDIVRDGIDGFVLPIRDVEALKEKLQYLYDNPDIREEIGQNALKRVHQNFTWDDYGHRITEAYRTRLQSGDR